MEENKKEEQVDFFQKLEEAVIGKQQELKEFLEKNSEKLFSKENALKDEDTFEVSGKFLNDVLGFLSHIDKTKTDLYNILKAYQMSFNSLTLTVDSLSLDLLSEYRKQQTKSIL